MTFTHHVAGCEHLTDSNAACTCSDFVEERLLSVGNSASGGSAADLIRKAREQGLIKANHPYTPT